MHLKIILIDLDGVLNEYKGDYDEGYIPEPKKDTKEFLEKLSNRFRLILFTTRNKLSVSNWLIKYDFAKYFSDITDIKVPAYLYIDDRTIRFDGDYNQTITEIEKFKVYWE